MSAIREMMGALREVAADVVAAKPDDAGWAAVERFDNIVTPENLTLLLQHVERLERALEPFANLGRESAQLEHGDDRQAWGFDNAKLTWGDFRKASAALSGDAS